MYDLRLSPETLLQLAPGVRTRLDAAGHVLVDAPDGTVIDLGPRGFATLSLLSRPLALGHAIDRLEAGERSCTDFLPTLSVINMLIEEGALVRPGAGTSAELRQHPDGRGARSRMAGQDWLDGAHSSVSAVVLTPPYFASDGRDPPARTPVGVAVNR